MPDLPPHQLRQLLCAADLYLHALEVLVRSSFAESSRHGYIRVRDQRARNALGHLLRLAGVRDYDVHLSRRYGYSVPVDTAWALLVATLRYLNLLWRELDLDAEEKESYQMNLVTIRFALTDLHHV